MGLSPTEAFFYNNSFQHWIVSWSEGSGLSLTLSVFFLDYRSWIKKTGSVSDAGLCCFQYKFYSCANELSYKQQREGN